MCSEKIKLQICVNDQNQLYIWSVEKLRRRLVHGKQIIDVLQLNRWKCATHEIEIQNIAIGRNMNGDKLQRIIDLVFGFGISVALKNAVPN